jgi:isopenicillin N synthase-like dioxygenase
VLSTEHTDLGLVEELRKTVPDLKETMEIGRDNHPVYKNNWPPGDVAFKEIMSSFFWTCQALQIQIMSALAVALGFENEYFTPFIDQGDNNLRILHYPPATAGIFDENQVRAGKHTDYGTITLLFQDSAGGLQVKSPGSTWVDVTPIPGTVVVNTGDLLNRWSNGLIASTQHQVVKPPTQPVDGMFPGRYSIA